MRIKPFLLPRLQDMIFLTIFLAVLLFGQRMLNLDGDLPRHLLTGKLILQTRTVPTTEPFIYPYEGREYVSHEWLADVILYLIHVLSGEAGIVLLSAILLASTFSILYSHLSARLNIRIPVFLIVAWGAAATSLNWSLRPYLFSMLSLAIWLVLTDKLERDEKIPLWYFPALMLLWVNLHGEFIAGILVLFAYAVGWLWDYLFNRPSVDINTGKRLWLILLFSLLATLLNPAGFRPWRVMVGFVNNDYLMSRMYEANPPDFGQPQFLVLLGLLVFSLILLGLKKERLSAGKAFLLAGFSAMSLMAGRNIHLYGVVAPFVLAEAFIGIREAKLVNRFEEIIERVESQVRGILWPVLITVAFGFVLLFSDFKAIYHFDPEVFPVDAVRWLEAHPPQGRMFNHLDWGGYIAFHLWPEQYTFIDSMADVTGEITRKFETVITLEAGWEDVLSEYQVEWVIIPAESRLADALKEAGFILHYQDETAVILRR